jgi:dGTPase
MLTRKEIENWEEKSLSALAAKSKNSRGRIHREKEHHYRSTYQRDRDRIIHSAAFRRLEYKTQVFVYHEGDYYRTRLTHTLEVTQIARTISRILRLNEDLTEVMALAHDLGHTPFGHAVENVLNNLMKNNGGFNHNIQGLRVVDLLEERYPNFKGLNLAWETREGIVKHTPAAINILAKQLPEFFNTGEQPTMEAQVMDLADEIAYDNHDIDDGIKSGMIVESDINKIELWKITYNSVKKEYTNLSQELKVYLVIRNLINLQVTDIIEHTYLNIKKLKIKNEQDVRTCPKRIVSFSKDIIQLRQQLRDFLFQYLYCHWRVARMSDKAKRFVESLFKTYLNNPNLLPPAVINKRGGDIKRLICDHIAGMTDRYALEEYQKLFDPYEKV